MIGYRKCDRLSKCGIGSKLVKQLEDMVAHDICDKVSQSSYIVMVDLERAYKKCQVSKRSRRRWVVHWASCYGTRRSGSQKPGKTDLYQ
jgi:hypothetical protein